ncbi:Gram-negative pili assembly chaperone%2C N-terminal domain [Achromobacter kerstersii]|nr:Gram-negative pili assembly chaperone%2C N-terminal domain [Achromobacter kerstersii]
MQRLCRAVLALCMAGWSGLLSAAALQISPVLVDIAPQQAASGIMLRNPGTTPVYGQVRIYRWEQANGDDVLTPTEEVQASPPIIQVPPGGEQLVRLVRASKELAPLERGYRLVIDEIPDPATPGINGVVLRLRYSVPVFVAGATPSPEPELAWNATRAGGDWVLRLANTGTRYAQVAALQVLNSAGKPVAGIEGLVGYALAQREREWRIPAKQNASGPVRIKALINGDVVTVTPRVD